MRRMISVPLILAAAAALSFLPVQDCLAYGPGDSWYYDHYRRGGPGVEYDYGTAPSGTYDYGGPSAPQGNAQVTADNTVRAYPGFNSNVPDTSTAQFAPGYWWDPNDDYWDDWDEWDDEDDWWYYNGGPGVQYGQGWRYSPGGWWFQLYGGSWLSGGWQLIHNRWYRFDQNGYMLTGWFTDSDGNRYYLNPLDDGTLGMMRTGWQMIDGQLYYFNTQSDGTMGRLFVNTTTPDGYVVGADGALIR